MHDASPRLHPNADLADLADLAALAEAPSAAVAWERGQRLPDAVRRAFLPVVDAWAEASRDPDEIHRADVGLAGVLRADDPADVARMRRLYQGCEIPRAMEDVIRSFSGPRVPADVAVRSLLLLEQIADAAGDRAGASAWRAQAEARAGEGDDPAPRVVVVAARARASAEAGREIEALLLARSLRGRVPPDEVGPLLEVEIVARMALGARDEVRPLLDRLRAELARLPSLRRPRVEAFLEERAAELAAAAGDVDAAMAHVDRAAVLRAGTEPEAFVYHAVQRGRILLDAGRLADAAAALASVACGDPARDLFTFEAQVLHACATWDAAHPASVAAVGEALDALETRRFPHLGGAIERELSLRLASRLASPGGRPDLAVRAFAAAAGAVLRRIVEIDHVVRTCPEGAQFVVEDRALLRSARVRLLTEHGELLRRLGPLACTGLPTLPEGLVDAADLRVVVCAWCGCLRSADGHWLPVQHVAAFTLDPRLAVTHGVCPSCRVGVLAGVTEAR